MISSKSIYHQALLAGIGFLYDAQQADGRFHVYQAGSNSGIPNSAIKKINSQHGVAWYNNDMYSIFPTLVIASALQRTKPYPVSDSLNTLLNKTYSYIRQHQHRSGLWNHFTPKSSFYSANPHDIDSTAMALSVLAQTNIPHRVPQQLIQRHRHPNGLFYTFFTFRKQWNASLLYWWVCARELLSPIKSVLFWNRVEANRYDIDAVVNANVLYYLGPNSSTKPVLDWILRGIQNNQEAQMDKWYTEPVVIYYFVTRCIERGFTDILTLKDTLLQKIQACINHQGAVNENPLHTALALNSLLDLGYKGPELASMANYLVKAQMPDGAWEKRVLYWGGPKQLTGWGSECLTTAICVEALSRFQLL